jgi:UDP-galactopyranose mutase
LIVLFIAAPNKVLAQKTKTVRTIEGKISDYECGDNCYLTIIDKKGKNIMAYAPHIFALNGMNPR